jgi:hypothetical protein
MTCYGNSIGATEACILYSPVLTLSTTAGQTGQLEIAALKQVRRLKMRRSLSSLLCITPKHGDARRVLIRQANAACLFHLQQAIAQQ